MKVPRERISDGVGGARQVIVSSNVAVEALVNAAEPQEVGGDFVGGGASFALPEECVEVVCFAEDCVLPYVEGL